MLSKWRLRRARRELAAALKYSEQLHAEVKHVQEKMLPEIRQRLEVAELAVLGINHHVALADPRTPASQSSELITLAMQSTEPRRKLLRPMRFGLIP
ncbi:MAG TPA: hypothetical protein VK165_11290 [Azonexus sp.]|nr:hypothetical protein [Azonexus sp.]